jgi:hypothetical protein
MLYTNIYVYVCTNCKCDSTSNQLAVPAENLWKIPQNIDSDEIFLDSVCLSDEATFLSNGIMNITAEFGVVSHLKYLSNINGICQRLKCEVAWWKFASLDLSHSGNNGDKRSFIYLFIYSFIHSFIRQCLYSPLLGPDLFFSFVIFFTDSRTPWTSDKHVARPLPTHSITQTQNKRTHRHPCLDWDSNPQFLC